MDKQEKASAVAYSCSDLAAMNLPDFPKSRQGWDAIVRKNGWVPFQEIVSPGKDGKTRLYKPPPEIQALIDAKRVAEPAAAYVVPAAAPNTAPEQAMPVIDAATTVLVTRCIVAAEKVLVTGFERNQQVQLGIDTWGMLQRMFPEKSHRLNAIPDADIEQLARLIYNARRAMEVARPDNIPPLV